MQTSSTLSLSNIMHSAAEQTDTHFKCLRKNNVQCHWRILQVIHTAWL